MEPERVQALRDTKALYDEGILDEAEYKAKKKELLAAPPAKTFDECAFVAPSRGKRIGNMQSLKSKVAAERAAAGALDALPVEVCQKLLGIL